MKPGNIPTMIRALWSTWRARQLTRLVGEIRQTLDRRRPGATLTAAVTRNPNSAYEQFFQNGVAWLRSGLVDALLPMIYTEKLSDFVGNVNAYRHLVGNRRVIPGVGIYKHNTQTAMRQQLAHCTDRGGDFALFSYDSLHVTHQDRNGNGPTSKETGRASTAASGSGGIWRQISLVREFCQKVGFEQGITPEWNPMCPATLGLA